MCLLQALAIFNDFGTVNDPQAPNPAVRAEYHLDARC